MKILLFAVVLFLVSCAGDVVSVPEPVIREGIFRTSDYTGNAFSLIGSNTGRVLKVTVEGEGIYHAEILLSSSRSASWASYGDYANLIFTSNQIDETSRLSAMQAMDVQTGQIDFKLIDINNLLVGSAYRIVAYR